VVIEFSPPINAKERKMEREEVKNDGGTEQGLPADASATVWGLNPDTEDSLIGQQQWQAIHERRAAGRSISAIAWAPYRRETKPVTLLDDHQQWLAGRAPQVNYSARILYQELKAQRGFTGSYEVVKLAVRPLRAEASLASLTQRRFETGPGEQAQVDWGQVTVRFDGVPTKVHVFVMTLGYSRRGYAEGFLHERMPNLLAAHERAFAHFGGHCECLLYDRMRTVVLGTTTEPSGERRARLNTTFQAFADHWGFTPRLCRPYRAQTKGKVESGVKYVKRNFIPGRTFRDLDDFNAQLVAWQAEVADVRIHGTTHQRPIDCFADEAIALVPTASQASFLQAMVRQHVGRRRLAGLDRRQSLFGAVRADRPNGRCRSRRRQLDHSPSRPARLPTIRCLPAAPSYRSAPSTVPEPPSVMPGSTVPAPVVQLIGGFAHRPLRDGLRKMPIGGANEEQKALSQIMEFPCRRELFEHQTK
jgi:transposase